VAAAAARTRSASSSRSSTDRSDHPLSSTTSGRAPSRSGTSGPKHTRSAPPAWSRVARPAAPPGTVSGSTISARSPVILPGGGDSRRRAVPRRSAVSRERATASAPAMRHRDARCSAAARACSSGGSRSSPSLRGRRPPRVVNAHETVASPAGMSTQPAAAPSEGSATAKRSLADHHREVAECGQRGQSPADRHDGDAAVSARTAAAMAAAVGRPDRGSTRTRRTWAPSRAAAWTAVRPSTSGTSTDRPGPAPSEASASAAASTGPDRTAAAACRTRCAAASVTLTAV
jgi:hypothetical protein